MKHEIKNSSIHVGKTYKDSENEVEPCPNVGMSQSAADRKTKYNKLIFLSFLALIIHLGCTQNSNYYMKEVYLDSVQMQNAWKNYKDIFRCRFESEVIVDDEEVVVPSKRVTYECDSIIIFVDDVIVPKHRKQYPPYTYYVEVLSSKYEVKIRTMSFRVGMKIDDLEIFLPDIKKRYKEYIGKEKQYFSTPAYFGKQMTIETNDIEVPLLPCEGLKFQILEGKVISIMIDFRTDGDFN
ncbi:MAG: hypothetical protein LBT48_01735 [Prevotellaceae bacterium]|jgi:hypothetical protein|nr:hypothetical protein [Prevotellaceae bacterium]